jgi:hypothetical protein
VRTSRDASGHAPAPARSRFGYDRRWWRQARRAAEASPSYWSATRRPLASLLFVLPMLLAYELGVAALGGPSGQGYRTGVDIWIRRALDAAGLTERWLPPLALVIGLLSWQAADRRPGRIRVGTLLGMAAESLILAVVLIGLSRLVDLGLVQLDRGHTPLEASGQPPAPGQLARLLGFVGAGVYEEAVFRLALIPLGYGALRLLLAPEVLSGTLAVTGSALVFSLAHHVGAPGEAFTWYAFIFRWFAGVYFAWVFVVRGFGVAVGTHVAYDWLVGLTDGP